MKIAVNTRFLTSRQQEGVGWYTHEIMRRIVAAHPEDEFYFFFDRPFEEAFIYADNVKGIVCHPPARHPFLFYAWLEWGLAPKLKSLQPDVFFSPDGFLPLSTDVACVPVIHDLAHQAFPAHIPFWQRQYYNYFIPKFAAKAKKILTVSNATKDDLVQRYGLEVKKIAVAYNACRSDFRPLENEEKSAILQKVTGGSNYFICISAIHPRKNIERLIRAFAQFKKENTSDIKLLLVGKMAWKALSIKQLKDELGLDEDLLYLPYVAEEELPELLGAALAMIYVSLLEGFGMPLVEAMQAEIPIITSNVSAMPEIAGTAALLVDPLDIGAIADAMGKIYKEKETRKALCRAGKKELERFNWDESAEKVYQVLKQAIS